VTQLNFPIPDDLHRRVKVLAALEDVTLRAWVERAIVEAVERAEKKR
jgi:predicted HicB family RNase H-like nuclease